MKAISNANLRLSGWITLAMVAASIDPILIKFGYRGNMTAAELLLLRNFSAALFLLPFCKQLYGLGVRAWRRLLIPGCLLFATNLSIFLALQSLSVVVLITIVTTTPALVALVNSRLGRESTGHRFWLGLFLCFGGVLSTLEYRDVTVNLSGLLYACLSAISSTLYRVRMEELTAQYSPRECSLSTFGVQALLTLSLVPMQESLPDHRVYILGFWLGLSAIMGNIAFLSALNIVGSTRISVLGMLQRPLIVLIAAVLLQESLTLVQLLGIVTVMVGVNLAQVKRTADPAVT